MQQIYHHMYHIGQGLCCMYIHNIWLIFTCDTYNNLMHLAAFKTELFLFTGKWSFPPTTGPRPPPCSFFSFTAINDHQAVLFGGNQLRPPGVFGVRSQGSRVNDCFLMDFESMVCSERYCNNSSNVCYTTKSVIQVHWKKVWVILQSYFGHHSCILLCVWHTKFKYRTTGFNCVV